MVPNEDIIPITYMGGTGGNFLCHFIVSAKRNIHDIIELSTHGNSHDNSLKDILVLGRGIPSPDDEKLSYVFSQQPINFEKPWYTALHILSIDTINDNFKRSIRITYDLDDINDVTLAFYGKWYVDGGKLIRKYCLTSIKYTFVYYSSKFVKIKNMPNVLFISWKELFKGNIDDLITKLSIFTDIDAENFSKESLIHWRNKTQYCIDTFTEI